MRNTARKLKGKFSFLGSKLKSGFMKKHCSLTAQYYYKEQMSRLSFRCLWCRVVCDRHLKAFAMCDKSPTLSFLFRGAKERYFSCGGYQISIYARFVQKHVKRAGAIGE